MSRIRTLLGRLVQLTISPPVRKSASPSSNRVRPKLELLDDRVVPAALLWTGEVSSDAADPQNWYDWDAAGHDRLPTAGDDLTFGLSEQFPSSGSADCNGLTLPSGSFASISIAGYSGTVTFGSAITTDNFRMEGGAISQPTSGTDLTVTGNFTWIGGTLNSSTNAAMLHLSGATGAIDPGAGNTITTGDTLSLEVFNGLAANATFNPGTLQFNNGTGVTLGGNTMMFVNANAPGGQAANVTFTGDGKPWTETDTQITLNTGARLTVTGPGSWTDNQHALTNQGGTIEITGNGSATLGPLAQPQQLPQYSITQSSGFTKLHSGSTLKATISGMVMSGGEFDIIGDSPVGETAPAKLDSDFTFTNGLLGFLQKYWTFEVNGNVTWAGGTLAPRVDAADGGTADLWWITGSLTIPNNNTAKVQPSTTNYAGGDLGTSFRRQIFRVDGGMTTTNLPALINTPSTPDNPQPTYDYYIPPADPGTTQRNWYLGPKVN